ncbi:AzlC family ABC transporter permease [Paucisalibacillus globulus]|uniref:AzlC family ABC transporter permease n=1 Tax=Paucisalibacillus globulus TaxID=351095 RepID=UPI000BB73C60|nr:AzlC family ABC transporter permease [Paucisalibacillus globulus]
MDTVSENKKNYFSSMLMIKRGLAVGFPIMLGYIPIAITYGVLAKQAGLSLMELTLMSVLVFAGASQFMGANMIALGAGAVEIIIATFVLNFRHFVMSLSFMNRLREVDLKWKFPLSLGLTDETFAVSSLHTNEAKEEKGFLFYGALTLTAYLSWVIGSFLGGVLGKVIPETLSQSMGIALYAMFIGLLVPSVKKELRVGLIAVIAMLINVICLQFMSSGWAIVAGTVLGGLSGVFLLKEERR